MSLTNILKRYINKQCKVTFGLKYIYVAKTKALISFAVTAKLICVFVFAFAKSRFSHDEAQMRNSVQWFGGRPTNSDAGYNKAMDPFLP